MIRPAVDGLLARGRADILSIGAILALWSGSRALKVIVQANQKKWALQGAQKFHTYNGAG